MHYVQFVNVIFYMYVEVTHKVRDLTSIIPIKPEMY